MVDSDIQMYHCVLMHYNVHVDDKISFVVVLHLLLPLLLFLLLLVLLLVLLIAAQFKLPMRLVFQNH